MTELEMDVLCPYCSGKKCIDFDGSIQHITIEPFVFSWDSTILHCRTCNKEFVVKPSFKIENLSQVFKLVETKEVDASQKRI